MEGIKPLVSLFSTYLNLKTGRRKFQEFYFFGTVILRIFQAHCTARTPDPLEKVNST